MLLGVVHQIERPESITTDPKTVSFWSSEARDKSSAVCVGIGARSSVRRWLFCRQIGLGCRNLWCSLLCRGLTKENKTPVNEKASSYSLFSFSGTTAIIQVIDSRQSSVNCAYESIGIPSSSSFALHECCEMNLVVVEEASFVLI